MSLTPMTWMVQYFNCLENLTPPPRHLKACCLSLEEVVLLCPGAGVFFPVQTTCFVQFTLGGRRSSPNVKQQLQQLQQLLCTWAGCSFQVKKKITADLWQSCEVSRASDVQGWFTIARTCVVTLDFLGSLLSKY